MRIHLALTLAFCAGTATAQTQMPIPAFSRTFTSAALTRGFWFQAPSTPFIITGLRVPDESNFGFQNVEVTFLSAAPPAYPTTTTGTQQFYATGVPSSQIIPTTILVPANQYVGILGACGDNTTMRNSYGVGAAFTSSIMGNPVTLTRFLTQTNIVATGGNGPYSEEVAGPVGRVEVYYTPSSGLFANFSATPQSGPTPLRVNFTDTTFTSDPGGVTSWAWDLDGNGTIDSTVQNPNFTYMVCGRYDVTLTATDATHPPSTVTKPAFITADPQLLVDADFTGTPTGGGSPLVVNFTDTSTGSPTSWAWDLDGDGTIDSSAQNPSFTYTAGGGYTVSLTASNACGSDTETKQNYIFVVANDECTGAIPVQMGFNGPFSNVGSTPSASGWTCAAGSNDVWFSYTALCNLAVTVDTCTGSNYDTALQLFDGTCTALNWLACNDDSCGLQSAITFNATAGTTYYIAVSGFGGRTGTFGLSLSVSGAGSFTTASSGCGATTLTANGSPNIGGGVSYTMGSVVGTPLMWIGTNQLNAPLCSAGCNIGTEFGVLFASGSVSGPIPCAPYMVGATFYVQGADLGASGGCPAGQPAPVPMTVTDTILTTIG